MSASLEYGTSASRVLSVTETSQVTVEDEFDNNFPKHLLFLYWNLMDSYTFVDFDMNSGKKPFFTVLGVIESAQTPALLRRYDLAHTFEIES